MFKSDLLNQIAFWILLLLGSMWLLTAAWNFVMPLFGLPELTMFQFTVLFVLIHSFTIEIIGFKRSEKKEFLGEK